MTSFSDRYRNAQRIQRMAAGEDDFTDPEFVTGAVLAQVEDLPKSEQIAVLQSILDGTARGIGPGEVATYDFGDPDYVAVSVQAQLDDLPLSQQREVLQDALSQVRTAAKTAYTLTEWAVSVTSPNRWMSSPGVHDDTPEATLNVHRTVDEPNEFGGIGKSVRHPEYDGLTFDSIDEAWEFARSKGLISQASSSKTALIPSGETYPCATCGKPATHFAFQTGTRASGFFACEDHIDRYSEGRTVERIASKTAAAGQQYRVTKPGVGLFVKFFSGGGMSERFVPLNVGDVITRVGDEYSGGHDGINEAAFEFNGETGTFSRSSWGSPNMDYLEPVTGRKTASQRMYVPLRDESLGEVTFREASDHGDASRIIERARSAGFKPEQPMYLDEFMVSRWDGMTLDKWDRIKGTAATFGSKTAAVGPGKVPKGTKTAMPYDEDVNWSANQPDSDRVYLIDTNVEPIPYEGNNFLWPRAEAEAAVGEHRSGWRYPAREVADPKDGWHVTWGPSVNAGGDNYWNLRNRNFASLIPSQGRVTDWRKTAELTAEDCIDSADGNCSGKVEYRMPLSSTGVPFPRCDRHWLQRLDRERQNPYPDSPIAPSWFDPADAGERWDDDY